MFVENFKEIFKKFFISNNLKVLKKSYYLLRSKIILENIFQKLMKMIKNLKKIVRVVRRKHWINFE